MKERKMAMKTQTQPLFCIICGTDTPHWWDRLRRRRRCYRCGQGREAPHGLTETETARRIEFKPSDGTRSARAGSIPARTIMDLGKFYGSQSN